MADRKATYTEFWPYYLQEHAKPQTRHFHYVGTALVIVIAGFAVVTQRWLWLLAMPVAGYFFAWVSHAFVERNKPATFTHPFWSLISDFRMFFLWISGRLGPELEKAGVATSSQQDAL
ncbi:MAG: DUF962 domain-containing protein [Pseudomonadota bacterium]